MSKSAKKGKTFKLLFFALREKGSNAKIEHSGRMELPLSKIRDQHFSGC